MNPMMMAKASDRKYEDFDPVSDLLSEEGCDTLILYLPGFRKEQLKVQLTTSRILRISGERPIGDNKWKRFNKEFQISPNTDTKEITAKFEGGILHIRQPKLIVSAAAGQQDKEKPAAEAQQDKGKAAAEVPKPQIHEEAPASQSQPEKKANGIAASPSDFPGSSEAKLEEKEERKEEATTMTAEGKMLNKREETNVLCALVAKHKQVYYGSGLFKELRKPETQRRLATSVIILLVLVLFGFYITNIRKSYPGKEQQSLLEFEHEEL